MFLCLHALCRLLFKTNVHFAFYLWGKSNHPQIFNLLDLSESFTRLFLPFPKPMKIANEYGCHHLSLDVFCDHTLLLIGFHHHKGLQFPYFSFWFSQSHSHTHFRPDFSSLGNQLDKELLFSPSSPCINQCLHHVEMSANMIQLPIGNA